MEKLAGSSFASVAPTHTTLGSASTHGQKPIWSLSSPTPSLPPLPADTTYNVFGCELIASSSAWEGPDDPRLALTTATPCSPPYSKALATAAAVPWPSAPSTRSAMTFAVGAMPTPPTSLSLSAATMPDTWLPWPFSSPGALSPSTKSQPRQSSMSPSPSSSTPLLALSAPSPSVPVSPELVANWPSRSGAADSTPVSTTATVCPLPVDCAQAPGA